MGSFIFLRWFKLLLQTKLGSNVQSLCTLDSTHIHKVTRLDACRFSVPFAGSPRLRVRQNACFAGLLAPSSAVASWIEWVTTGHALLKMVNDGSAPGQVKRESHLLAHLVIWVYLQAFFGGFHGLNKQNIMKHGVQYMISRVFHPVESWYH